MTGVRPVSNHEQPIAYTVKTGDRAGLQTALSDLDLDRGGFEVVLYPERSHDYSLRTETVEGVTQALTDLPTFNSGVVRVFEEGSR